MAIQASERIANVSVSWRHFCVRLLSPTIASRGPIVVSLMGTAGSEWPVRRDSYISTYASWRTAVSLAMPLKPRTTVDDRIVLTRVT